MKINEKLAELIDWSGKTQQQIADQVGVTRANISAYVMDKAAISVEMAYKLADALGVSPWTLLNNSPLPATEQDLTTAEAELITKLRSLTPDQYEVAVQSIELMYCQNKKKRQ